MSRTLPDPYHPLTSLTDVAGTMLRMPRALHEGAHGLATDPDDPPPTPWCADRLEAGMVLHPSAAEWTGDWSRCIAWTWLELREEGAWT